MDSVRQGGVHSLGRAVARKRLDECVGPWRRLHSPLLYLRPLLSSVLALPPSQVEHAERLSPRIGYRDSGRPVRDC